MDWGGEAEFKRHSLLGGRVWEDGELVEVGWWEEKEKLC